MSVLIRLIQSLPLIIALAVIGVVVYALVSWLRTPLRAKEVIIKLFLVLTGALSVVTLLATLYAMLEGNANATEFFAALLVVSAVALAITLICRAVFIKHHPNYKFRPAFSRPVFHGEGILRKILELLQNSKIK